MLFLDHVGVIGGAELAILEVARAYRAMDAAAMDGAIKASIDPNGFTWVIVGDKARVLPQLRALGMKVEVIDAPAPPK